MRTLDLALLAVELTTVLTLPHSDLSLAEVSAPLILLGTVLNKSMEVAKMAEFENLEITFLHGHTEITGKFHKILKKS